MGDNHKGLPEFLPQVEEQLVKILCRFTVQIPGRFIGIDDAWRNDPSRHGIRGIRERVLGLGGTFELNGIPNQGTVLRVIMPHD